MTERIMPYLPEFYRDIRDFAHIGATEDVELDALQAAIDQAFDNQFVMTADLQSVKRRERMLNIQADPATETLNFRRKRIINRYSTKPPFTIRYLQQHLDRLVGPGMTIVSVDAEQFILYVTANIANAAVFREVQHTIDVVKPANLIYQQSTSINGVIGLEEHASMQAITWNYKLDGSWQLGQQPFSTLGQEVPIV